MPGRKVYVWNLPFTVDWAELKRMFTPAGAGASSVCWELRCVDLWCLLPPSPPPVDYFSALAWTPCCTPQ